jgi:peroxin-14
MYAFLVQIDRRASGNGHTNVHPLTVLQDPSVAGAPIEQRMAFLRSKNLTAEEIDASLARAGQSGAAQAVPAQYRQAAPQYGNASYQSGYPAYWQQTPLEPPRRDWRDWFIAATVMGGAGYALYWTAKRYVVPLIAPPTPPQIQQDKASVDASFDKAFALLEQLATDTQQLKDSEAARKERLDAALADVESVVTRMRQANEDRDLEAKRIAREISEIREQIPRAIEKEKEATDNRLKELNVEMKSLKTLVVNRMVGGGGAGAGAGQQQSNSSRAPTPIYTQQSQQQQQQQHIPAIPGSATDAPRTNGVSTPTATADESVSSPSAAGGSGSGTPYSRLLNGKAAIPSWQLAAQKRSEEAKVDAASPTQNTAESGTMSEAS